MASGQGDARVSGRAASALAGLPPTQPLAGVARSAWNLMRTGETSGKPFNSIQGLQGLLIRCEGDPEDS